MPTFEVLLKENLIKMFDGKVIHRMTEHAQQQRSDDNSTHCYADAIVNNFRYSITKELTQRTEKKNYYKLLKVF